MSSETKFTFSQKWRDLFGKEIDAVKDKIGKNRFQFSYHGAQWAQEYQFSKLPNLKMKWVQKLIAVRDNEIRTRKDLLRITDPDKANMTNWGNTTFAYLQIAGFMEKVNGVYKLTPLGEAVVDYAEKHSDEKDLKENAEESKQKIEEAAGKNVYVIAYRPDWEFQVVAICDSKAAAEKLLKSVRGEHSQEDYSIEEIPINTKLEEYTLGYSE